MICFEDGEGFFDQMDREYGLFFVWSLFGLWTEDREWMVLEEDDGDGRWFSSLSGGVLSQIILSVSAH